MCDINVDITTEYYQSIEDLKSKFGSFLLDADSGIDNRSASLRARKLSVDIRSDLRKFRRLAVANDRVLAEKRKSKNHHYDLNIRIIAGEPVDMPDDAIE